MRPDSYLLLVLAVSAAVGCARSPATAPEPARGAHAIGAEVPAPPPPKAAAESPPASAPTGTAIAIEGFDCLKAEDVDADGAAAGRLGIATWSGGGPSGATWNAADLQCAATLRTSCTSGTADVRLHIGKSLIARKSVPLRMGTAAPTFVVSMPQWRKNVDDGKDGPVRTAIFRLTALLTCKTPTEIAPGLGPRREFAADRSFVAGFADGE